VAPEPIETSIASTEGEWQRRVQWSTLLVPITTRVSFWITKPSSLVALAEASAPKWPRLRASPSAAASSASSQEASRQVPSHLINGLVTRSGEWMKPVAKRPFTQSVPPLERLAGTSSAMMASRPSSRTRSVMPQPTPQ
jgi:hypothetical protein